MRKYDDEQERAIRVARLVDEWAKSGLVDAAQRTRLAPELRVDLRRTNRFLRMTLFGFGILIVAAAVGFVAATFRLNGEEALAALCLVAAAGCAFAAELLVTRFRLYRFGIEEAAAAGAVNLTAIGASFFVSSLSLSTSGHLALLAAFLTGSIGAYLLYLRFGYVYAALASMLLGSLAPFQLDLPEMFKRLLAVAVLTGFFAGARARRVRYGDEFPGDDYGWMQAAAWLGIYAVLNLRLFFGLGPVAVMPPSFYWFTFATIWVLPAIGLWLAVRDRDRPLLDVSVAIALATCATNKPYLRLTQQTWDPILFGVFLIGTALVLRRWLAGGADGSRGGFTAQRILRSDKDKRGLVGTLTTFQTAPITPSQPTVVREDVPGGGGRSGGAGAGGSF